MREKKDIRLFFAIWPGDAIREQLHQASNTILVETPARRVPRANLHLTLHFIGNLYFEEVDCFREQARLVDTAAFDLAINCQGHFSKPRVAWLGCRAVPAPLLVLHDQLGQRLRQCGYQPEARVYCPHITMARKIGLIAQEHSFRSIDWRVETFSLVEVCPVENGVQYRVIEDFPLI